MTLKKIIWNICNLKEGEQKEACKRVLDKRLKRMRGVLPPVRKEEVIALLPERTETNKRQHDLKKISMSKQSDMSKEMEL